MENYINRVEKNLDKIDENQIILASKFYRQHLSDIPETAYYKSLERLTQANKLVHLTNGVYYKPKTTRFGIIPITTEEITSCFINNNSGIVVGYNLYNKYGITTQVSKQCEVLTNGISEKQKNIGDVYLEKIDFNLNRKRNNTIEALEILQNYSSIEDANQEALVYYMKEYAASYSDEDANFIIKNRKYKKSTIAFLQYFLNAFEINNSLNKYLSTMSNYNYPRLELAL